MNALMLLENPSKVDLHWSDTKIMEATQFPYEYGNWNSIGYASAKQARAVEMYKETEARLIAARKVVAQLETNLNILKTNFPGCEKGQKEQLAELIQSAKESLEEGTKS